MLPDLVLDGAETCRAQDALKRPDFKHWERDPANFTDMHRMRRVVDLGAALGERTGVVYLMAELLAEEPATMRFEQTLPNTRAWIGGAELRHGDRLRFAKGTHQMVMELKVENVSAHGLHLSPRFWTSEDVGRESAEWAAEVARRRPYLEAAISAAPGNGEADAARRLLAGAK